VALVLRDFLGSITFDFDKANRLSEDEHMRVFIALFEQVWALSLSLFPGDERVDLLCKRPIEFASRVPPSKVGRRYSYRLQRTQVEVEAADLARGFYVSKNDEITVRLGGGESGNLLIAKDPVYFRLSGSA